MILDFCKIVFFLIFNNNNYYIFFNESNFTYNFLKNYIYTKNRKKVLIFSFEKINIEKRKNIKLLYLKNKFFRELFFLFCKSKFFYTTTPDIGFSIFKRSFKKKIKYIYLQHSMFSLNAIYNDYSFINFDAVQCISEMQKNELDEINEINKKKIKGFKSKYLFPFENFKKNKKFKVLIAPTWSTKFYENECFENLIKFLNKNKLSFKVRRHAMSIKNKELNFKIIKKYNIQFYEDSIVNFEDFDYLISDWSGILIENYFIKKRKSYAVNIKQKIRNKNYNNSKLIPTEVTFRNSFSNTYEIDNLENLVLDIMKDVNSYSDYEIKNVKIFYGY